MANPQVENGYTRISNELLEAIFHYHCSGAQKDLMFAVIRATYGFNRTSREIGTAYLAKLTGRHGRQVAADVRSLIERKVLIETERYSFNKSRTLMLNKDYSQWVCVKSLTVSETIHRGMSETTHLPMSETIHQIKKERQRKTPEKSSQQEDTRERAEKIYTHYASNVRPAARADAIRNIQKQLKEHTPEVLIACIESYRVNGMAKQKQYRIQANNFFGKAERFKEYLSTDGSHNPQRITDGVRTIKPDEAGWR